MWHVVYRTHIHIDYLVFPFLSFSFHSTESFLLRKMYSFRLTVFHCREAVEPVFHSQINVFRNSKEKKKQLSCSQFFFFSPPKTILEIKYSFQSNNGNRSVKLNQKNIFYFHHVSPRVLAIVKVLNNNKKSSEFIAKFRLIISQYISVGKVEGRVCVFVDTLSGYWNAR